MVRIFKIVGDSMNPSLCSGAFVIGLSSPFKRLKPRGIYAINHPHLGVIVKRCLSRCGEIGLFAGDSETSMSSKEIGQVRREDVLARIFVSFSPHNGVGCHF